jgi:type I restriction enzyme S subunit
MSEGTKNEDRVGAERDARQIKELLDDEFPGEWGDEPSKLADANAFSLRATNLSDDGRIDYSTAAPRVLQDRHIRSKKLFSGDLILEGSGGSTGKPVGRVALFEQPDNNDYTCTNFFRTLRPNTKVVEPRFLFRLLHQLWRQPAIWHYQQQTTNIKNLKHKDYLQHEVSVPSLPQQRYIADILDTVDRAIRKTEEVIDKLERIKKGLLHDLLTRGIDENGELRDPHRHPEQFKQTELGLLPKEWEVVELDDVLSVLYRYPSYYGIDYVSEGVPEVRGEVLQPNGRLSAEREAYRYVSEETAAEFPKVRLRPGDFVMSVRGTVGKVAVVPNWLKGAVITANTMRLSFERHLVKSEWMQRFLLSEFFQRDLERATAATTIKTIKSGRIRGLRVALPSIDEQARVAARLSSLDRQMKMERHLSQSLGDLKTGLEDALFG